MISQKSIKVLVFFFCKITSLTVAFLICCGNMRVYVVQLFEESKMSSKNPTSLGVLLRKLRLDTNINQEEMATILKISPSYLSAIENGNRRLSNNIKNSIKSILSPYYHDDEIQKAILLSDPKSTIEIDVPPSETKKNFLVFLRANISEIPDFEIEKIMSKYHANQSHHSQSQVI